MPRAGPRDLHDLTIQPRPGDRVRSRMWHVRRLPRSPLFHSGGRSCRFSAPATHETLQRGPLLSHASLRGLHLAGLSSRSCRPAPSRRRRQGDLRDASPEPPRRTKHVGGCRIKASHRKLVVIRYQIPRHDPWPGAELWRCGYVYVSLIASGRAGRFGWLCASHNGECLCDTLGACQRLPRSTGAALRGGRLLFSYRPRSSSRRLSLRWPPREEPTEPPTRLPAEQREV
jgi:hypothetical protein